MLLHNGRPVETIVFDWSGTISDDRQMVYQANMLIRKKHGKPVDDFQTFLDTIKMTAPEAFGVLGIPGTTEELQNLYIDALREVKEKGVQPESYQDASVAIGRLNSIGIQMAILSSHPDEHVRKEATSFGLYGYFRVISGDCHDKAIGIRDVLASFNANPQTALYVGDTVYDIRAAKLADVASAGIATGYMNPVRLQMEDPDFFFYSLSDLAKAYG